MQGNAGKHDLNFRAPHLWATHSKPPMRSRRIVSAPAHVSPDPTPRLSQVLWEAFGWNYLGLNIFVRVEFMISPSISGLSLCFGVEPSLKLSWVLIWGSLHFTNVDLQVAMTTEPSTLKVWIAGMFDRWFREKWGVCWSALEAKFAPAVPMKCQMLSWKLWKFWCCCTFGKKALHDP